MSSNPYDFSSGFVGAMEASARKEEAAIKREQYDDRRAAMERDGMVPKKKSTIFGSMADTISGMVSNLFNGGTSFAQKTTQTTTDPAPATGISVPDVQVDQPRQPYADGSPGGIQAPTDMPPEDERPSRQITDEEKLDTLRSKSPFVALSKEDPKAAQSVYEQVSDFKKLSNTLTTMAVYDFIDGKGSEGLRQNVAYLRNLQKEGVFEAAVKASNGDMAGAKKAFMSYGDIKDPNFDIVPRDVIDDNTGVKGGKTKYKVFDIKFPDGSGYTLDAQKLALEALSAKEYLERGDKEFEKDYKRAEYGLHVEDRDIRRQEMGFRAQESAQRAESLRQANEDRKDRAEESRFNRGITIGNSVFDSISRSEIAPLESKFEKETAPYKDIAMTNPKLYEEKVAPIRAQYDAEIGRRKMAFEAARQRYLIGLQKGERIDPYAIYSNAYRMLGNQ